MRFSAEEVQRREDFLVDAFKKDPTLTVGTANDIMKREFKLGMVPARISELKKQAKAEKNPKPERARVAASEEPEEDERFLVLKVPTYKSKAVTNVLEAMGVEIIAHESV